ncbi:MAG: MFS transporter [Lachnospiraceae bacterium]
MNKKKFTYRFTQLACYLAFIIQAVVVNFAPICFVIFQDTFDLSLSLIGQLIVFNFVTQIVVDIITMRLADKIGHRKFMLFGHSCIAIGFILFGTLPRILVNPYIGLVFPTILYAIGGGIIEVLGSPIVDSLPEDEVKVSMSLLHSFYCWGQVCVVLITSMLLLALGNERWYLIAYMWAILPVINIYMFSHVPLVPPHAKEVRMPLRKLLSARLFLLILLMMMCAGASELTMSQWSSLFAEKGLGIPKMLGDILGPCLFAVFMGLGRTMFGIMEEKLDTRKWLIWLSVLCALCYFVAATSNNAIVSLLACALTGFSISLMWPGTYTLATKKFPLGGTAMFGIMAVFGDIGCSAGPFLAGVVADNSNGGLNAGFLFATIFPLLMILGALGIGKKSL